MPSRVRPCPVSQRQRQDSCSLFYFHKRVPSSSMCRVLFSVSFSPGPIRWIFMWAERVRIGCSPSPPSPFIPHPFPLACDCWARRRDKLKSRATMCRQRLDVLSSRAMQFDHRRTGARDWCSMLVGCFYRLRHKILILLEKKNCIVLGVTYRVL